MNDRRFAWLTAAIVAVGLAAGCARAPAHWKGEQTKRDIYLNLMTPEEQARFELLEADWEDDERLLLYCQEIGVYQQWRDCTTEMRRHIRRGELVEGMTPAQVRMAWGPPETATDATTPADRADGHKRTLWRFALTSGADDVIDYQREACFLDDRLLWFKDFSDPGFFDRFRNAG